jgi:hypothetical protein
MGLDLRFDFRPGILVGASYYTTNGYAGPSHDVDGGNPIGGVANWMEQDVFQVYSLFGQVKTKGLTFELEYTAAQHDAVRSPERVAALIDAGLNPAQLERFFMDPDNPSEANVITDTNYQVRAAYTRLGYEFRAGTWEFTPYAQVDYYTNPENIDSEDFGGDHEAGLSDDGVFLKSTLGLIVKPARFFAIKIDGSTHTQDFNGKSETYPEVRTQFSLYWELGDAQ